MGHWSDPFSIRGNPALPRTAGSSRIIHLYPNNRLIARRKSSEAIQAHQAILDRFACARDHDERSHAALSFAVDAAL
jgi:hypothetical protein